MQKPDYSALIQKLRALGFPPTLDTGLHRNTCLGKESFQLKHVSHNQQDTLIFILSFKREEDGFYMPTWYEATLRKRPNIPIHIIETVDITDLDNRMSQVNWKLELSRLEFMHEDDNLATERAEIIYPIIHQLKLLESVGEGKGWADLLKWIHWIDTPMEHMLESINRYRSIYEVTQRYYFFEEEDPFSIQDSCRFLSHRWREKRMQDKLRTVDATIKNENKSNSKS